MRIDCHTHAFSDAIAERAISALHSHMQPRYHTSFDGRVATLVHELRANGFDKALLCQIATKPTQYGVLLRESLSIRDGGYGDEAANTLIPLMSVHPADPDRAARLREVAGLGFPGVKLHSYFQEFDLDSPDMLEYYRQVRDLGLFVVVHAGFDPGFTRTDRCGVRRVLNVVEALPDLRMMVSHLGGLVNWEDVSEHLVGAPVDMEISNACQHCPRNLLREILLRHDPSRLYFGTDWPWSAHDDTLRCLESLPLPPDRKEALLGRNAQRFLNLPDPA